MQNERINQLIKRIIVSQKYAAGAKKTLNQRLHTQERKRVITDTMGDRRVSTELLRRSKQKRTEIQPTTNPMTLGPQI